MTDVSGFRSLRLSTGEIYKTKDVTMYNLSLHKTLWTSEKCVIWTSLYIARFGARYHS